MTVSALDRSGLRTLLRGGRQVWVYRVDKPDRPCRFPIRSEIEREIPRRERRLHMAHDDVPGGPAFRKAKAREPLALPLC